MRSIRLLMLAVPMLALTIPTQADEAKSAFLSSENWEGLIKEYFKVEGTTVVGTTPPPKGLTFNTFLCSKKKYKDFEMKFQVRLKDGIGNSGIQIRSKILNAEKFSVSGPQCDIGANYWGSLYGEQFGGMMKEAPKAEINKVLKPKDFNDYYIKVVGKHVTIKVNGVTAVDQDFEKMPDEGIIAFQIHAGPPMEVTFKDVQFTDLSAAKK